MQKKSRRESGYVCFRFSNAPYTQGPIQNILEVNLESDIFTKHDLKMPFAELCTNFTDSYSFLAEEKGGKVPGYTRGLAEGDWMLIHTSSKHKPTIYLRSLIAPWRYKSALEKYCSAIAWTPDMENAVYVFKSGYPTGTPDHGSVWSSL